MTPPAEVPDYQVPFESGTPPSRRNRYLRKIVVVAVVVFAVLGAWAFWLEPSSFQLREHRLEIPNWPENLAGLRIAALADIHVGSPFNGLDKLEQIVALTNQSNPDIIVLLGDYVIDVVVGGKFVPPNKLAPVLAELRAPLGVWAVLGNHDLWLDAELVQTALEHHGIQVLEDSSVRIRRGSDEFWLAGIDDLWEGRPDITRAFRGVPEDSAIVAITHNPDLFPDVPPRVNLLITGHTHGGQVRVPFFGPLIVPSSYGRRYAAGHIVEDGRHLFVSSGLGTSILPVRFLVPPEISLLVIETEPRARATRQREGEQLLTTPSAPN